MDFSQLYFNKPLHELSFEDIEVFFQEEHTESETLEFKSFSTNDTFDNQLNKGIIKTISAFLNSSGGLLIWGAPAGIKSNGNPEEIFIGELKPVNVFKGKDALINIISSRISPVPVGISVQVICESERVLYIFQVQPSIAKPHQFNDKYFVRLDGQSKPAPHYLVEALFKQINYPDISGHLKFEKPRFDQRRNLFINVVVFISNFSPFLNDEKINYQLVIQPGVFTGSGSGTFNSETIEIIHYGKPIRRSLELCVEFEPFIRINSKIKFILSFGGKLSPAKLSTYTLEIRDLPDDAKNGNELITEMRENLLFSDHQKTLGKGKDTFVKDILGR